MFVSQFPKLNREALASEDRMPSKVELKKQLSKSGTAGWTMVDLLADFNLLLYLCESLDIHGDMPKICESIVDRSVPLDDGYKILIKGIAGLEGSY
jgi:nuclear protein localization protein 4 homolog